MASRSPSPSRPGTPVRERGPPPLPGSPARSVSPLPSSFLGYEAQNSARKVAGEQCGSLSDSVAPAGVAADSSALDSTLKHEVTLSSSGLDARSELEQTATVLKYSKLTRSHSDGEDIRWYFCKSSLRPDEAAAQVPASEIVGKGDYFRFSDGDSLALEASFVQREEELVSAWWKEYAEVSAGPTKSTAALPYKLQTEKELAEEKLRSPSCANDGGPFQKGPGSAHSEYDDDEESVGVLVKGGLYEVDLMRRRCIPVYWRGEHRRVLRGHWYALKAADWLPLREDVAEQLEIAYHKKVWRRRTFQPSGLYAARVNLTGTTVGLHALFTGEDASWEASLAVDASGISAIFGIQGSAVKLRRGFAPPTHLTQDEVRQRKEEELDDYASKVPVRHVVFMVHGIGQRLEKANLVDDVGTFRQTVTALSEHHLTPHQRNAQRILFIPCQWRRELKLGGEVAMEQVTLDGVRALRTMITATVHDVLYYMSPIYCQDIIDSVTRSLNRLYARFIKRNPSFDGKVSLYGHSLGSVLTYDILCHQDTLQSPFPVQSINAAIIRNDEREDDMPKIDRLPSVMEHEFEGDTSVEDMLSSASTLAESSVTNPTGIPSNEIIPEVEAAEAEGGRENENPAENIEGVAISDEGNENTLQNASTNNEYAEASKEEDTAQDLTGPSKEDAVSKVYTEFPTEDDVVHEHTDLSEEVEVPEKHLEVPKEDAVPQEQVEVPMETVVAQEQIEVPKAIDVEQEPKEVPKEIDVAQEQTEVPKQNVVAQEQLEALKEDAIPKEQTEVPKEIGVAQEQTEVPEENVVAQERTEAPKEIDVAQEQTEAPKEIDVAQEQTEVSKQNVVAQEQPEVSKEDAIPKEQTEVPKEIGIAQEQTEVPKEDAIPKEQTEVPKEIDVAQEQTEVSKENVVAKEHTDFPKENVLAQEYTEVRKQDAVPKEQTEVLKGNDFAQEHREVSEEDVTQEQTEVSKEDAVLKEQTEVPTEQTEVPKEQTEVLKGQTEVPKENVAQVQTEAPKKNVVSHDQTEVPKENEVAQVHAQLPKERDITQVTKKDGDAEGHTEVPEEIEASLEHTEISKGDDVALEHAAPSEGVEGSDVHDAENEDEDVEKDIKAAERELLHHLESANSEKDVSEAAVTANLQGAEQDALQDLAAAEIERALDLVDEVVMNSAEDCEEPSEIDRLKAEMAALQEKLRLMENKDQGNNTAPENSETRAALNHTLSFNKENPEDSLSSAESGRTRGEDVQDLGQSSRDDAAGSMRGNSEASVSARKQHRPFIIYPKLKFKVETFYAVGSPLGMFLALRNIRIGQGAGTEYWQDEGINEEMPACRLLLNIFHPYDPVAYRLEPLICKEYVDRKPVFIPYHKGGKRIHIGLQEFGEDISMKSKAFVNSIGAVGTRVAHVFTSKKDDSLAEEEERERNRKDSKTYGQMVMERLTGSPEGRIDCMLQDATFEHQYISAISSHTSYWQDPDTALFILKHLYRDIPEEPEPDNVPTMELLHGTIDDDMDDDEKVKPDNITTTSTESYKSTVASAQDDWDSDEESTSIWDRDDFVAALSEAKA